MRLDQRLGEDAAKRLHTRRPGEWGPWLECVFTFSFTPVTSNGDDLVRDHHLGVAAPNRCCVTFAGLCAFSLRCCQYALRRESLTGAILLGSQHSMPQGI